MTDYNLDRFVEKVERDIFSLQLRIKLLEEKILRLECSKQPTGASTIEQNSNTLGTGHKQ